MNSYSVGLSGLTAAQRAFDIIGNNIANAATKGYHRQRIDLTPAYNLQTGPILLGGGVDIARITRLINNFLEQEILCQQSSLGQVSQESTILHTIETAFGELSSDGSLSAAIDQFFNSFQQLSAHPSEATWQRQTITAAESMANQFRTLGQSLSKLDAQIVLEAKNIVEQINSLTSHIAELNNKIEDIEVTGGQTNNLYDQRDQCIAELSQLIGVETQTRRFGVIDISAGEIPLVTGSSTVELQAGLIDDGKLAISIAGTDNYKTDIQGGKLGGLLSLKNELVCEIRHKLDHLARAIIHQVNQYHVQGVGAEGSFTELIGWPMMGENLADFDPSLTNGTIYIRVINTVTGEITRHQINVDISNDSLTTIAAAIDAITGLTASVTSLTLHIQAEKNYKFDFLPSVLPQPTTSNLTGTSPPTISVSGIYTGIENQTFTFTVIGTGLVGNGDLQLEVKNGAGEIVTVFNIGKGYAADDELNMGNGIKISLSSGELNEGDSFEINAIADSDTSGLLAAIGLNTFFSGRAATDIAVCSRIIDSPSSIATALGAEMTDNTNALKLAGLKDQPIDSTNAMTPQEFYNQLVTDIGQCISVREMHKDNLEAMIQSLADQRDEISGVNINDEAAQMLIFEQMFQAMAKYLNIVQSSLSLLMELV